jgi:hypothetical protein
MTHQDHFLSSLAVRFAPARRLMHLCPFDIVLRGKPDTRVIDVREVSDHLAGHASEQHPSRDDRAWQHHGTGRDQGTGTDDRASEYYRADPDQGASFHPGTVDGRVMTDADPVGELRWLAGINVQTAQVLEVALRADRNPISVGSEHGPVPDARLGPDAHRADDNGARRDPGQRVDERGRVGQGANERGARPPGALVRLRSG